MSTTTPHHKKARKRYAQSIHEVYTVTGPLVSAYSRVGNGAGAAVSDTHLTGWQRTARNAASSNDNSEWFIHGLQLLTDMRLRKLTARTSPSSRIPYVLRWSMRVRQSTKTGPFEKAHCTDVTFIARTSPSSRMATNGPECGEQ